jgi:hypothetical protein
MEKASIINEPLGIIFYNYKVPRVFRLLAEMEKGGSAFYTYGLEKRKMINFYF